MQPPARRRRPPTSCGRGRPSAGSRRATASAPSQIVARQRAHRRPDLRRPAAPPGAGGRHRAAPAATHLRRALRRHALDHRPPVRHHGAGAPGRQRHRDADLVTIGRTLKVPAGGTGGGGTIRCPVQGGATLHERLGLPALGRAVPRGQRPLRASRATPAVATVSGTVVQTIGSIGGNQVKLFGDDGAAYYYTHLDRLRRQGTSQRRQRDRLRRQHRQRRRGPAPRPLRGPPRRRRRGEPVPPHRRRLLRLRPSLL